MLKDPAKRAAYDRARAAGRPRVSGAIAEELDLDDLSCTVLSQNCGDSGVAVSDGQHRQAAGSCGDDSNGDGGGGVLHRFEHPCRCGGRYSIDEGELPEV